MENCCTDRLSDAQTKNRCRTRSALQGSNYASAKIIGIEFQHQQTGLGRGKMTKSILGVAIAALILTASMAAPATAGCAEEIERAWKDKETFVNRTKE